jgi:ADP-heptose:LPS heptosyltransferase/glycosyltransferase involved in cell wall biosynthesis
MDFSIVICTYNHSDALERTLLGIFGLSLPAGCEWELILVDNCCTDHTVEVCQRYEALIPLRYLREERQGRSHALNAGVAAARGGLVLLTDDDVDVAPGWAATMVAAAQAHDDADFFGGKVLSRWQGQPPGWFMENPDMIHSKPLVDLGEASQRFASGDGPLFIGANLAVRMSVFEAGFTFHDGMGPKPEGEEGGRADPVELEWQQRLLDAGHEGMYVPEAFVYHRDPRWQMTEQYVRQWYMESGRDRVKQGEVPRGREWLGAPQYLWRELVNNGLKYLCNRWLGPSRTWLAAECQMSLAWGSILECRASRRPAEPQKPESGEAPPLSPAPRVRWRKDLLEPWINRQLVRMGPGAFIGFHWPWPAHKPYMRRALTIQALGDGLGDELMCLPIIEEIKRRNPRCRIRFVTRRPEFFRGQPQVDDVAKEKPGRRVVKLVYNSVIPPPRPLISLMGECVGIDMRFPRIPPLQVKPSDQVKSLIESLPRPLLVVQPLATGRTTNKNWPLPYWKECVRSLAAEFHVVEVGNEPVLPAEEIGGRFTSVSGGTTLHDLAYVISQADLFIGPSSGGMHLANAYDVPALIIFGGYESPEGYDYDNVHPLYSPVVCAPCWRQTCPYDLKCLHAIKPATVVAQALRMLGKSPAPRAGADAARV